MASGNDSLPTSQASSKTGLVDDAVSNILVVVFFVAVAKCISFFGIISNILNIIVFIKQGFKDTVNITLFSLAVSDLGVLVTFLWESICFNPLFINAGLPFDHVDIVHLTGGWPDVCFSRITSWITGFVTLERCLCIALPLKVKAILTPKRTICVVVGIFLVMIASVAPVYYSIRLGPKYFPQINETKIGMIYIPNGQTIENVSVLISIFSQFASFFVVIVCTTVLIQNLIRKSKWRESTSSSAKQESFVSRDKRVVKMILSISIIFIACFLPTGVNMTVMLFFAEYSIVGRYQNLYTIMWAICKATGALNSSVNIFVYYNMSSKYKEILYKMLHRDSRKGAGKTTSGL